MTWPSPSANSRGGVGRQTHQQLDHRSLLARQQSAGIDQAFGELGDLVAMFLGFLLGHLCFAGGQLLLALVELALALIERGFVRHGRVLL